MIWKSSLIKEAINIIYPISSGKTKQQNNTDYSDYSKLSVLNCSNLLLPSRNDSLNIYHILENYSVLGFLEILSQI